MGLFLSLKQFWRLCRWSISLVKSPTYSSTGRLARTWQPDSPPPHSNTGNRCRDRHTTTRYTESMSMPASHATAHETHRAPIPSHRRHYKASTFNTCELPLRDGPLDPHTSTSLQSHCTGRKMLKDCDVRLGVLEQVPVGEQVTWCHRMVTCAKKDGSLRRTIL